MFSNTFYPTPLPVIEKMTEGEDLTGKTIYEPSAGKGDIVDFCIGSGAALVIASEINKDLKKILQTKCQVIAEDFFTVESDKISHVDYIILNPPFDTADKHIVHAYNVAPAGCKIIALCNYETLANTYTATRKELSSIIDQHGTDPVNLGNCFETAERRTQVQVGLIKIQKPGSNYKSEFEGFFLEEEPEEAGENGIMSYNVVRDLVNRYIASVKLYDQQLELAVQMNELTGSVFFKGLPELSMSVTRLGAPVKRNEFKKSMMKAGWNYIFDKMNLTKHSTRGLRDDINKFVEQQNNIPFTMKNIYHMLDIVIGTTSQRMDKALEETFDKITEHSHENRMNIEGWKTNSHYLVNKRFILPSICYQDQRWYKGKSQLEMSSSNERIEDFIKALCYITGDNPEKFGTLYMWVKYRYKVITDTEVFHYSVMDGVYNSVAAKRKKLYENGIKSEIVDNEPIYGEWFDWGYFRCKGFKKGSMHFEFKDEDLWARFNQRISRIKGYPLFEARKQTEWQKRQTGRPTAPKEKKPSPTPPAEGTNPATQKQEFKVLSTFKIAI